jgi:hypothetical protein
MILKNYKKTLIVHLFTICDFVATEKTLTEFLKTEYNGKLSMEYIPSKDEEKLLIDTNNEYNIFKEYFSINDNQNENLNKHLEQEFKTQDNLKENINIKNTLLNNLKILNQNENLNVNHIRISLVESIKNIFIVEKSNNTCIIYVLLLVVKILNNKEFEKIKNIILNNNDIKNQYKIYKEHKDKLEKNDENSKNIMKNEIKKFYFIHLVQIHESILDFSSLEKEFHIHYKIVDNKNLNEKEIMDLQEKYIDNYYNNTFITKTNNICEEIKKESK